MNIYRHQFVVQCPVNPQFIVYELELQSAGMVRVEHIVTACALHKRAFHEEVADDLAARFPGTRQVIRAHHHGVDVETRRGFE